MTEFDYTYEIQEYRQRTYQIGVRVDPSFNTVESFAVVLFFRRADGERVTVAKVDNAEHDEGRIHIDRHYREQSAETKDFDIDVTSWEEAEEYLLERWRRYADRYEETHGTSHVE
jgi:hypothetical protein